MTTRTRLAWALLALTLVAGLTWGAIAPYSWDVDNIAPGSVLKGLAARFGPHWFSSYGPVPYLLVASVYVPLLAFLRLIGELGVPSGVFPWGFRHPDASMLALIVTARAVCVALALGIAWLATRERWAGGRRDAVLVPLLLLGSPTFVYYSRTTNVDLFYLFFLALAFHLAERREAARAWIAAGAAAALAVCCKEQSAPLALIAGTTAAWRALDPRGATRHPVRAATVVLAAVVAYAIVWVLPFHLDAWRGHHRFIFEEARYPRTYAADPAGILALLAHCADLLPVTLGWATLAGAALGLGLAPREAGRGLGPRALAGLLYVAGFLATIGYVYPRFLLPLQLVALPLAVRGWDRLFERAGRAAPAVAIALVALCLSGGPLLGLAQWRDPRNEASEWLDAHLAAGRVVEIAGNPRFQARLSPAFTTLSTLPDSLERAPRGPRGDAVLVSGFDRYVFETRPSLRAAWWDSLTRDGGPYAPAAEFFAPRWTRPLRGLPISPSIWIWTRRDTARAR